VFMVTSIRSSQLTSIGSYQLSGPPPNVSLGQVANFINLSQTDVPSGYSPKRPSVFSAKLGFFLTAPFLLSTEFSPSDLNLSKVLTKIFNT